MATVQTQAKDLSVMEVEYLNSRSSTLSVPKLRTTPKVARKKSTSLEIKARRSEVRNQAVTVWLGRAVAFGVLALATNGLSSLTAQVMTKGAHVQSAKSLKRAHLAAESISSLSESVLAYESYVGLHGWAESRGFTAGVVSDQLNRQQNDRLAFNH